MASKHDPMKPQIRGLTLRCVCRGHDAVICRVAWSPDGSLIASPSYDKTVRIWETKTGKLVRSLTAHSSQVTAVAWSPDGTRIATGADDLLVFLWDPHTGEKLNGFKGHSRYLTSLSWSASGSWLATGSADGSIRIWDVQQGKHFADHTKHSDRVYSVSWSHDPNHELLASGSEDRRVLIWDVQSQSVLTELSGHTDSIRSIAWSADSRLLFTGSEDKTIRIWDVKAGRQKAVIEGHTALVTSIAITADEQILASKSKDNSVRLWRTDTLDEVACIDEVGGTPYQTEPALAFHPRGASLVTFCEEDTALRIWDLDIATLLGAAPVREKVRYTSAKIVLVGESNVGKSCLSMRLADDRYPEDHEHGTTHGMRFWPMEAEELHASAKPPEGHRRDVVLWDFGGQDEYQLVHQMFLHDTTLALVLIDPTRGAAAFEDARKWNKKLEKQVAGRKIVKLLVGSKVDEPTDMIDRAAVNSLKQECGFDGFLDLSAKVPRNIEELREAVCEALKWDELAKTSRPELFQRIRDEIELMRQAGDIIVLIADLESSVRENRSLTKQPKKASSRRLWEFWKQKADDQDAATTLQAVPFDDAAFRAVTDQLSAQGTLVKTKLFGGDDAIVLQLPVIEQYAGSLILLARNNPRGVPAIEEQKLASPDISLPGMAEKDRIERKEERIVLECVVELMVKHGICFRHEGLLVFPSLLKPTESDAVDDLPGLVSLYYDFSGAIDNVYASLIAWLVLGKEFGRVRLWNDRVEFEVGDKGACGLRKVNQGGGYAHLDVYFEEKTPMQVQTQFISFVHDHLKAHDIHVVENFHLICSKCRYEVPRDVVQRRMAIGETDVQCPVCNTVQQLSSGIQQEKDRNHVAREKAFALMTKVREDLPKVIADVKQQVFRRTDKEFQTDLPIRLLHLSDLHFDESTSPNTRLQWLIDDIRKGDWLEDGGINYLVVSGDMTDRGQIEGFQAASSFVSNLIAEFDISAERCVFVPGNHDVVSEDDMYKLSTNPSAEQKKHAVDLGEHGFLVRNENRYWDRFNAFSDHFYHRILQRPYPSDPTKQGVAFTFPEVHMQFLGLNSCWEIDRRFPERVSLHADAVANLIKTADQQIDDSRSGKDGAAKDFLRIGVWHHPVRHPERGISNLAVLDQLLRNKVRFCLTGDIHKMDRDAVRYWHSDRTHVIGAGSFGASASALSEGAPRLYNVIEIPRNIEKRTEGSIKVWTRQQPEPNGVWKGWNEWHRDDGEIGGLPYFFI